jgi:hypothetical protein
MLEARPLTSTTSLWAGDNRPSVVIERHGDVLYEHFSDGRTATVEKQGDTVYERFKNI